jgi:Cu/Zn superoxide dismutase
MKRSAWFISACVFAGCLAPKADIVDSLGRPGSGAAAGVSSSGAEGGSDFSEGGQDGGSGKAQGGSKNQTGGNASSAGTNDPGGDATANEGGGAADGGEPAVSGSSGAGGSAGNNAGSGGTGGGQPTAVANLTGVNGNTVLGTATFTEGANATKLVIQLSGCPDGEHAVHIHMVKDCSDNGNAAGGHWVPNGENIGNVSCVSDTGSLEVLKSVSTWTVGGPNDVSLHALMLHAMSDAQGSGARIGCGVINIE